MRYAKLRWTRVLALCLCVCLVEGTQVHSLSRSNAPWLNRQDVLSSTSSSSTVRVPSIFKFLQEPLDLPPVKSRFSSSPRRASLSSSPTPRPTWPVPSPPASAGPSSPKALRMKRAVTLPVQLDVKRDREETTVKSLRSMTPIADDVAKEKSTPSETSESLDELVKMNNGPWWPNLRGRLPSLRIQAGDLAFLRAFRSSMFSILIVRLLIQSFMTGLYFFVCFSQSVLFGPEYPLYHCSIAPKTGLAFYNYSHVTQIMALSAVITFLKVFHQLKALIPLLYFVPSTFSALHTYPTPPTPLKPELPPGSLQSFLPDEFHIWLMAAIWTAQFLFHRFPTVIQS